MTNDDLPKKSEPWADTHGLHLGIKMQPNGLGWALIRPRNTALFEEGRERVESGTIEEAALKKWQEAPERPVTLYKYANEAAYRASPDKDGMSRQEHGDLVDRVARKLRRHGAHVSIEVIEFL